MDPFIWPVQYPYNPHPSTPSPPITLGSLVHNLPWPEPAVPFLKKPVVDSYGLPCSPVTGLSQYAEATPGHTREEHMAWLNSSQGFEFVAQTRGFDHQVHLSAEQKVFYMETRLREVNIEMERQISYRSINGYNKDVGLKSKFVVASMNLHLALG